MYYDMILENGRLFNSNVVNVGIMDGKIHLFENESTNVPRSSKSIIDLNGKYVLPGFIDAHSHTDEACFNRDFNSKIIQGITTEICGNCGGSAAPLLSETSYNKRKFLKKLEDNWYTSHRWKDFNEYFEMISKASCVCNQVSFVGLWTIYDSVHNFEQMYQIIKECLDNGCVGVSINQGSISWTGLSEEQKLKLFQLVYCCGKVVAIHLSSYSDFFYAALDELTVILNKYPVKIVLSHMKFLGLYKQKNIDYFNNFLIKHSSEADIRFDIYPYLSICTRLKNIINENGYLLRDFYRIHIFKYNINIEIKDGKIDEKESKFLVRLYRANKDLLVEAYGIVKEDMEELLLNDKCFVGTDYTSFQINSLNLSKNPERAYSSFPTAFNILSRKNKGLASIITKFSIEPANYFGINNRGAIFNGSYADMVVCDISQYDIDIKYVFVNGKLKCKNIGNDKLLR